MEKRRGKAVNRRKKPTGKRPLIILFVVIILILLSFLLLETLKRTTPVKPTEQPAVQPTEQPTEQPPPVERHKMPVRPGEGAIEQQPYTTAIKPLPPRHPRKMVVGPGTVAIIVDDMGSSMEEVKELMAIKLPLTFSIIPGLAKGREVAQAAHANGYLVMIHIPMEPQGYPKQRMEKNGLLLAQSDAEIQNRVTSFMQAVPFASGANNHMGSRFTEDKARMGTVLGLLKGKGLFFIDSKTTPHSVGYSLAREMGIETASRNVFIDNVQNFDAIRVQLDQLAEMARRKGAAIGICHPHKTTIIALTSLLPELHRSGINFVFAGDLVR